jgi:hypothetical protein
MQRLHAAVEHLGEPGVCADLRHRETRVGERFRGAAGGQQYDSEMGESAREVDESRLVGHREQRLLDGRGHGSSYARLSGMRQDSTGRGAAGAVNVCGT